jgi:hypothetical protein
VGCIEVAGLNLWFNSNDHLPPHFHASKLGEWEIRIYFLRCSEGRFDFDLKWGKGPTGKLQKRTFGDGAGKSRRTPRGVGAKGMHVELERRGQGGFALVSCDDEDGRIPPGFPVLRTKSLHTALRYQHLFVLCSALRLPEAAKLVAAINREHRLQALFVRTDVEPDFLPQMLERAGLRSLRNMLVHSDPTVPRRVLSAWLHNAQTELIARATVADDRLIVVSCEPKTYEVRFDQMPALRKIAIEERYHFEIAEDGSFIWWPSADIHLDLDALRTITDPSWRKRAERLRRAHGCEYGEAIARLRKEHGLRQTDVSGVSERQLRRVEESGAVSFRMIEQLAKAHGMAVADYLDAVARKLPAAQKRTPGVTGSLRTAQIRLPSGSRCG